MINPYDVKKFAVAWKERGSEKSDAQVFWLEMLQTFGIKKPAEFVKFEEPIYINKRKCFIDIWIAATRVLIENKSRGIDLDKPAKQSDGKFLTPFEQAKRYADARPYSQRPRRIVLCNFVEIRVYDMDLYYSQRDDAYQPSIIAVERLPQEFSRLNFLIDPNDENVNPALIISKQAGVIVADLYRAFERNFDPAASNDARYSALNKLCVRLVFCLYAEDADIFDRNQFTNYLRGASDRRQALIDLFRVLGIKNRDKSLPLVLRKFPYVDGELFVDDEFDIPEFNASIEHYLIFNAGDDNQFDWRRISPTIFGALFESTLNPITRRTGGMHYTSPENIHKVLDPLFLDDLHEEFRIISNKRKNRQYELEKFQLKLASLTFLDPACGSGNFLTETYVSLRTLENYVIRELCGMKIDCSIKISIENFYGIEINGFAVAVAQTALWIAESQMMQETEMIMRKDIKFLPLKKSAHIIQGNSLELDWKAIAPRGVDYIIGNPPFSGKSYRTREKQAEMARVFDGIKGSGNLDYVACRFKKAADFMIGTETRAALVATNSICQGIAVPPLWNFMRESGIHIDFAHRAFKWLSESDDLAAVYCVVIGFSHAPSKRKKLIYEGKQKIVVKNINAYLLDAPDLIVESRAEPPPNVPHMTVGSCPTDGGHLLIEAEDYREFVKNEPRALQFIHQYVGSDEFINGKLRWCLWLKDATAEEIASMPLVAERVEAVRQFRLSSKKLQTQRRAETPHLFAEDRYVPLSSIIIPRTSSDNRWYVPIGFIKPNVVVNLEAMLIPKGTLFHFGLLISRVHMAWMRVVCGRFGTGYRYSTSIVYNTFPCPDADEKKRRKIARTAKRILDVRAQYPGKTLAWLYDAETMPSELFAAHVLNDRAVMEVYGFDQDMSEAEIVTRLMKMYAASTTKQ